MVAVLSPEELEALLQRAAQAGARRALEQVRAEGDQVGVTPAEAARRLGLSLRTVQRRINDGTLPSVKVGGARRVQLAAVLPSLAVKG